MEQVVQKRAVQFDKNCSPYLHGERATFPLRQAATLVGRGIAHYIKRDEYGQWVPDKGEEDGDDAEHEASGADGTGEQEVGNEHQSGGDPTQTGGNDSGAATKQSKRRRARTKL